MLAPDVRRVAVDLLRPPAGYRLEHAVLTTYSLDLETLLALPLAVLTQSDLGMEGLLADPLLLVEALREASGRIHVFVDAEGMAIPRARRDLYALLEGSVHPVRAPGKGAFHPKLWTASFLNESGERLLRVAVMSRNLTFDRSWDVALTTEAVPGGRKVAASAAVADLVRSLATSSWNAEPLPDVLLTVLTELAGALHRTRFPSPLGFEGDVRFHAMGLRGSAPMWRPQKSALRVLAVAPFLSLKPLEYLAGRHLGPGTLVARQDQLDALGSDPRELFDEVFVLSDAALGEEEEEEEREGDGAGVRATPRGLHAKLLAFEHGYDVTWWVGSANLSHAAWHGANVELMAALTGRKGRRGGKSGEGIHRFFESGFRDLCQPYERCAPPEVDEATATAKRALKDARAAIVEADLRVSCDEDEHGWRWTLEGDVSLPEGVTVSAWPVTRSESEAVPLELPMVRRLPKASLTSFVAFRIEAPGSGEPDERLVRKLPVDGMPEGRVHEVLRGLIGSPEQLLRFLRALLGGLDGLVDELDGSGGGAWGAGAAGLGGDTLLEDLVRAAAREPARLAPIRRILDDLQKTEEGRALIPDGLIETWNAVQAALEAP